MDDYDVGYGKPPSATRFKPGTSGNRSGRPKRDPSRLGEIVNDVFDTPIQYRENGRARTATRREVALKSLVQRALNGDVEAADNIQRKRAHALRRVGAGSNQLLIRDWLPDYPGQTSAHKVQDLESAIESRVITPENVGPAFVRPPETEGDSQEAGIAKAFREISR